MFLPDYFVLEIKLDYRSLEGILDYLIVVLEVIVTGAVVGWSLAGKLSVCEDLDITACQNLKANMPRLCTDDPLFSDTCKKSCGLCRLVCHDCPTAVNTSADCQDTKACAADEMCMLKQHSVGKVREYVMTCEKNTTCEALSSGFHLIGKRADVSESRDQLNLNVYCCNTDLCNYPRAFTTHAPTTTYKPTHPPTTTQYVIPLNNCSKDIVFMLDSSSSNDHDLLKSFVQQVLSHVRVGPRDSFVAMVGHDRYGSSRVEWYFFELKYFHDPQQAVSSVPYIPGTTHINSGFRLIRDSVLTADHGDRSNAQDVVVLVSDGGQNMTDYAFDEANALQNAGVDIMVIAAGQNADVLKKLARPPSNYIYTSNSHAVSKLAANVASRLCML